MMRTQNSPIASQNVPELPLFRHTYLICFQHGSSVFSVVSCGWDYSMGPLRLVSFIQPNTFEIHPKHPIDR